MSQIGQTTSLIGNGIEKYVSEDLPAGNSSGMDPKRAESRLAAVGKEFEGVFLSLMLKEMRNTLDGGGFFGEETSDTYGGMFDMFIGEDLAKSSPLGIGQMLLESQRVNQEGLTSSIDTVAQTSTAASKYMKVATGEAPSETSQISIKT